MYSKIVPLVALVATARAQSACTLKPETHPPVTWQECKSEGSCETKKAAVTVDANWRWLHSKKGPVNCYTGNEWNTTLCQDNKACTENCCFDGADYPATYGVTTSESKVNLKFVTKTPTGEINVGSRLYLMDGEEQYQIFKLLDKEFTFDVDLSKVPCGLNAALYFVSMDADGGKSRYPTNQAGAKYGTGYCDAQCARDLKFINGQANSEKWVPSKTDPNAGVGGYGSCCAEMDVWEANSISTAFTPHPCKELKQSRCTGGDCGGTYSGAENRYKGVCDPDGCDFNSYRMGVTDFYGPGKTVDTKSVITVVTQFIGKGGDLAEIKRFYVQNGKVIANSKSTIPGVEGDSITEPFCEAQKTVFEDPKDFQAKGGLKAMGKALDDGMVLTLSLWDDHYAQMLWLDSTYPVDSKKLGAARGTCPTTSGDPKQVEKESPDSAVVYSNIKYGPIGSTFKAPK